MLVPLDSDTDKLCLGEDYELVVVRVHPNDNTFRSLSLSPLPTLASRLNRLTARSDGSARLPPTMANAFMRLKPGEQLGCNLMGINRNLLVLICRRFSASPWNFARWLSKHFCPDAAPVGALTALKEATLLSLASCPSKVK